MLYGATGRTDLVSRQVRLVAGALVLAGLALGLRLPTGRPGRGRGG